MASIISATYDASTGILTVTGTDFLAASGATNDIVANKFTFTAEGGATYTLTDTANVEISSSTSFTVTLSATDRAALSQIINKNGTSSTSGTTYNLAAAEDWAAGADPAIVVADLTGNGISVSNVPVPTITSATFDAATGTLVVTGSGFVSLSGAANDIDASRFTFTGEGGATYTLTNSADVDITSATSFTVTLSATDRAAVSQIMNSNGTTSTVGTAYNLSAAEDWAMGADAAVVVADLTGNGISVSNVPVPTITSATYDASTGTLVVTGSGFSMHAPTADIDVSRFTFTGEGGATYSLTDSADVEITSSTSFTVTLSATDRGALSQIINKNGTSSTGATTYNLAAAEDWAAGAAPAVVVADLSGNGMTVSNVPVPTITSATYNEATGALVVTGSGFSSLAGAANDIDVSKLTLTGEGGATRTLSTSPKVEITSATSFTVFLAGADRAAASAILNSNGTSSTGGTTYNLAAAEDWAAGADAAVVVADLAGNGINVTLNSAPSSISLSASNIAENSAAGTIVGLLSGTDPDAGDAAALGFSLVQNPGGAFAISGGNLVVADGALLDFETVSTYDLVIRATDPGGLSRDQAFTITLDDVLENPTGTSASDLLVGDAGDNAIFGRGGDDLVRGRQGNDIIGGGSGNDLLRGGMGDDLIDGGMGDDRLVGRLGSDTFFFRTSYGRDVIRDFVQGEDVIDVSGWKAIEGFSDLMRNHASEKAGDVWIVARDDILIIRNITKAELDSTDFQF